MREIPTCSCCSKENDNNMNKQKPHGKARITKWAKIAEEANYLHNFHGIQVTINGQD